MFYRIIKWAAQVTQASKNHVGTYATAVAVIVNLCFGIASSIMAATILTCGIISASGDQDASVLSGLAIVLVALLVVWGIALRVVEIYLEATDDKDK